MKKKNKTLIFLFVLMIIVLDVIVVRVISTENKAASSENAAASLYDRGLALVQGLNVLANDENYCKMAGVSDELASTVDGLAQMDYSQPKAVYKVTNLEDYINLRMYLNEVDENSLKGEAREYADKTVANNIATNLVSDITGTLALAACSVMKKTDLFVDSSVTEPEVYIYIYDEAYPVFVTFVPGDDGAVSATGTYVIVDALIGAEVTDDTLNVSVYKLEVEAITE